MSPAQVVALIVALAVTLGAGNHFLQLASLESRALTKKWFFIGCAIYMLSAVGGVVALRHLKLATVGVVCALSTVLLPTLLGAFAFGESLNRYEVAAIIPAAVSISLLWRFGG